MRINALSFATALQGGPRVHTLVSNQPAPVDALTRAERREIEERQVRLLCVSVSVSVSVSVCVCACVRACVRVRACVCLLVSMPH